MTPRESFGVVKPSNRWTFLDVYSHQLDLEFTRIQEADEAPVSLLCILLLFYAGD